MPQKVRRSESVFLTIFGGFGGPLGGQKNDQKSTKNDAKK